VLTGVATPVSTYMAGVSNSWATFNAAQNRMYVYSRTEGRITSLARDPASGALTVTGSVPVPFAPPPLGDAGGDTAVGSDAEAGAGDAAGTDAPAPNTNPASQTVTLDSTEHYLLVANFNANYVYVYALNADGTVGAMVAAHSAGVSAHQTVFPPGASNHFVLTPYRGSALIALYGFDDSSGALSLLHTTALDGDGGQNPGPRHLAFHPVHDTWVYGVNEIGGTLSYYRFNNTSGDLSLQQNVSSVPPDYTGTDKFASEIAIAPSGNYVYVSNRYSTAATFTQEGSLGVFSVDAASGQLAPVNFQSSHGALPRHFMLSKDGSTLVVSNQNSNNIAVFGVDTATGALTFKATSDVCATPFFVQLGGN
jgi:6-phosphogluconolactonase